MSKDFTATESNSFSVGKAVIGSINSDKENNTQIYLNHRGDIIPAFILYYHSFSQKLKLSIRTQDLKKQPVVIEP